MRKRQRQGKRRSHDERGRTPGLKVGLILLLIYRYLNVRGRIECPGGPRRASAGPPGRLRLWTWAEAKRLGPRGGPHAGRGEAPGRRRPSARTPYPPSLRRAGVVGILCAGGFPAPGAPGARIIPNSPPRRAEARRAGRPAARGTAGKNFLKKVLDTAGRAR